ncbi:spore germination protein [Heyndrickxia sp. NPDC080065]|uniref:spore germination protein n=1 Tax=Heyndrickxia sp. NPDC080065 TaxID=3390568 RepID=UPI003D06FC42
MPVIIGASQIVNVNGGIADFGDAAWISPKSAAKTATGSGSTNTGALFAVNNAFSINTTFDNSLIDEPIAGNS